MPRDMRVSLVQLRVRLVWLGSLPRDMRVGLVQLRVSLVWLNSLPSARGKAVRTCKEMEPIGVSVEVTK